jgi:hypothetical protein
MLLVEFCGLRGIVGHECNMPDASHPPSPSCVRRQKRSFAV